MIAMGVLDTPVKLTEADVESGTVGAAVIVSEILFAEAKLSENGTNLDALEGSVLDKNFPVAAEFGMVTLEEIPIGDKTVFGICVGNGFSEKIEHVGKTVTGKDIFAF